MRTVNRFESNLLKIVYCVLGKSTFESTSPALFAGMPRPKCISRDTVELVQAALAKGITQRLASDQGWLSKSFLRNDKPVTGRLWDRTKPDELGLSFSKFSLDFLIWLTSADLTRKTFWKSPGLENLTLGDKYLFAAVMDTLAGKDLGDLWTRRSLFFTNGLAVLAHADRYEDENVVHADFAPWVTGQGAAVIEGLQGTLAKNWIAMEVKKGQIRDTKVMQKIGQAQATVLKGFMDTASDAGRRDLCRFLLVVLKKVLEKRSELTDWTRSMNATGLRIADRTVIKEAAAAVLLQANRFQTWHQQSLTSGYLDENYAAMQLWKSDWERLEMQPTIDKAIRIGKAVSF